MKVVLVKKIAGMPGLTGVTLVKKFVCQLSISHWVIGPLSIVWMAKAKFLEVVFFKHLV
jgi:hypothetical protein